MENEDEMNWAIFWEDNNTFSVEYKVREEAVEALKQSDRPGHISGYLDGHREEALEDAIEFNHPLFKRGLDIGDSFGHSRAIEEAIRAHQMGELELWLEAMRPKTLKGWKKWKKKYGKDFADRWKRKDEDAVD